MARSNASTRGYYLRREIINLPEINIGFCRKARRHERIVGVEAALTQVALANSTAANAAGDDQQDAA